MRREAVRGGEMCGLPQLCAAPGPLRTPSCWRPAWALQVAPPSLSLAYLLPVHPDLRQVALDVVLWVGESGDTRV